MCLRHGDNLAGLRRVSSLGGDHTLGMVAVLLLSAKLISVELKAIQKRHEYLDINTQLLTHDFRTNLKLTMVICLQSYLLLHSTCYLFMHLKFR